MRAIIWVWCVALIGVMAGCGAIPTREEIADRIAERALEGVREAAQGSDQDIMQAFENNRNSLSDLPNTAFSGVPDGGMAAFTGAAQLTLSPPNGQNMRRYVGRANVGIDFGSETVVGRLDRFSRRDNGAEVTGNLSIRNGTIGTNRPNDFAADLRGTLQDGNANITMDSRILGDFRGTPIRGITVRNSGSDATWNGQVIDHDLGLFATRK